MLLRLRLVFAALGVVLAVVAIAVDDRRVTWVAIAMLAASVAVRLVGSKREKREERGE